MFFMKQTLQIRVIPNASKTELLQLATGYKAKLTAPPVDGKANEALILLLSKEFGVAKRDIQIVKGHTSKNKTVVINMI